MWFCTYSVSECPEENSRTFTNEEVDVSIKLHWAEKKITNLEEEIKTQADKIDELVKQMTLLTVQNCMLEKECKDMRELSSVYKLKQMDVGLKQMDVESEVLRMMIKKNPDFVNDLK
jgi:predicted RNase H-like nuclease (RuvC/YqgF family)